MSASFAAARAAVTPAIEAELAAIVPEAGLEAPRLGAAMRYALMAGGKRVRPLLTVLCGRPFAVPEPVTIKVGAAVECLHTYSLIHDDLPAMDDAAERRGRPSLHRAFDEATAILAGDALQAVAFERLAAEDLDLPADAKVALVRGLGQAVGLGGMCGGQMLDLEAGSGTTFDGLRTLQALKTGALITFACDAGAIAGGAGASERRAVCDYGRAVGAAFQIRDDLLDVVGDPALVGKDLGRDEIQAKATFVSALGVDGASRELASAVEAAETAVAPFGESARPLQELARYIAARSS
ncbi:MAG: polyprenyl synthetase family protein [Pseudomonadota bacterium]